MRYTTVQLVVLLLAFIGQPCFAQLGGPGEVSVSAVVLPANGRNQVVFEVDRPWRVSVKVQSPMGTALRIVDRIEGPGAWSGEPGEADGRVDLILDTGSYRAELLSPETSADSLILTLQPFANMATETVTELDGGTVISSTLKDLEQRSYRLSVETARTVRIEAAGRALTDLQIWRDGMWIVEIDSILTIIEPSLGKPMTRLLLAGRLEAGNYLITAYGGDPLPWAFEPEAYPFHIRFGTRRQAEFFAAIDSISPFGTDYYVVPGGANAFLIFLDEKMDFTLGIGPLDDKSPYDEFREWGLINKESVEPECLVRYWDSSERPTLVAITGPPGERYQLLGLRAGDTERYRFGPSGTHWFSTVHAGRLVDAIDATGIVVRGGGRVEKAMVPELGKGHGWRQRFNLLDETTLLVETLRGGTYRVKTEGVSTRVKIEPFLVRKPKGYRSPEPKMTPCTWDLEKGFHVVTFQPQKQGIVDALIMNYRDSEENLSLSERRFSCNAGTYTIQPYGPNYTLYINRQPGIITGLTQRKIPIDLSEPFFFELSPKEQIAFAIQNRKEGHLLCSTQTEIELSLFLDGRGIEPGVLMDERNHTFRIKNEGNTYAVVVLSIGSREEFSDTRPWVLPMVLNDKPSFPSLSEDEALYFDFERHQSHSALLRVPTPGSYTIESLGLLKTTCSLRTRTKTGLLSECCNGPGRNGLLSAYLGEGLYRITVQAQDKSTGRAGLVLQHGATIRGDTLHEGSFEALHVPTGHSHVNWLRVDTAGTYQVSTVGESRRFLCRIDDEDGWPLIPTGSNSSTRLELEPGTYSITTYPSDVEGSRITTFDEIRPYLPLEGKGPHQLALGKREENLWVEAADGESREADVYLFDMPAGSEVTVLLGKNMQGKLRPVGDDSSIVDVRRQWEGRLSRGVYRLDVESRVVGNFQKYWVEVSCQDLVAGTSKTVVAPAELQVSVGKTEMIALHTEGQHDVRVRLFSADGKLVHEGDDCLADWNGVLCSKLNPGSYKLNVTPVGKRRAQTSVFMKALPASLVADVSMPGVTELALHEAVRVLPLIIPPDRPILVVHIAGKGLTGYSLTDPKNHEAVMAEGSAVETTFLVTRPLYGECELRLWPWSRGSTSVEVALATPDVRTVDLERLEKGVKIDPIHIADSWIAPLRVEPDRASTYTIRATRGRHMTLPFSYAIHPGEYLNPQEPEETAISFLSDAVLLAVETGGDREVEFKGRPLVLKDKEMWTCFVHESEAVRFDLEQKKDRISVVIATARDGQPGIAFGGRSPTAEMPLILEQGTASAAALPGSGESVWLWNAGGKPTSGPLRVEVIHRTVKNKKPRSFPPEGVAGGTISDWESWKMPPGDKLVTVGCSEDLIVLLWNRDRIVDHALINPPGLFGSFKTDADYLSLLSVAEGAQIEFSVELFKAETKPRPAYSGNGLLYEQVVSQQTIIQIPLNDIVSSSTVVTLAEDPRACRWIDGNGIIHGGWDHLVVEPGGYLEIDCGPGLVKVYAEPGQDSLAARWGPRLVAKPIPIHGRATQTVPPAGGKWVVWWEDRGKAISVITDEAMCVAIEHQGSIVALEEGTGGVVMSSWLPAGEYHIAARGLAGREAQGNITISTSSAEPVEEPFGPWTVLKPGESRYYSLKVAESGKIGLGVQGTRDVARCELMTMDGVRLGEGVRMVPDLATGEYILRLYLPAEENAVKARIVMAGLIPPDTGPPEEYIRRLLSSAGFVQEGE